jgi:fructose-1,6-bisphosphatase I/sedoheptulose-1,7-bisphosphatase
MTPLSRKQTLTQYLIEQRRRFPQASGELNALILDVSIACKAIARQVALGSLAESPDDPYLGAASTPHQPMDAISHQMLVRQTEWSGHLAGMASGKLEAPCQIPHANPRGKYLLVFDPLDGAGLIDVNVAAGTVFSILRAPTDAVQTRRDVTEADFLQPGAAQVAAGYAVYGPATMLVLSVGDGVAGFTLDQSLGEFKLTHPHIQVPPDSQAFAIDTSHSRFWEPPVKRYVDECLAGKNGPRGKDFNMRWIASMVAEAHRILMRGGVFLSPRDTRDPTKPGRLRLLYEANPIGFLMEQAGARASTGRQPVLGVPPSALHQRIGLVFGSRNEVDRIERYHTDPLSHAASAPLFAERSLFRD